MPTPPDAIGVAIVGWYTSSEIQIFPLNYFSPFTLIPKQHACFRHCDIPVDENKMACFFLEFASSYQKQFMYFLGSI